MTDALQPERASWLSCKHASCIPVEPTCTTTTGVPGPKLHFGLDLKQSSCTPHDAQVVRLQALQNGCFAKLSVSIV